MNAPVSYRSKPVARAANVLILTVMSLMVQDFLAIAAPKQPPAPVNLALVATPTTSFVSGHETIQALNDGFTPTHSDDKRHGAYGNWPRTGTQWVQYEWSQPISTKQMEVYWFDDQRGVRLPAACRLLYWNGSALVPVPHAVGLGLEANRLNPTTFPEITTTKLRLEFDGREKFSTGILDWRVYDSGKSPNFPPQVNAGTDRVVIRTGQTYLEGVVRDDGKVQTSTVRWAKFSGPGTVTFSNANTLTTTARFSKEGNYVLSLTADDGQWKTSRTVRVQVDPPPPASHLQLVPTAAYKITSPFWQPRMKNLILNWIPHCIAKIDDPAVREGGIENFVQAGLRQAGQPAKHTGAPFANAWVYNTVESMCLALMVDAQGDAEVRQAQTAIRQKLEEWIPKLLGAQEPDGYLQTMYTINRIRRWSNKADHEGYNAGYFLEAAVAHYAMTEGKDRRLLDAARKLADCWVANIGPAPKKPWYEGHEELEQALVRFGRFIEEADGPGKGQPYIALAKFLLDSRKDGEEYDQSHLPVTRQYTAVGHAVRAVYCYSGMAEVAMETGDLDYHSAVKSIWNNLVHRKYYVTGGVGSGETSEGFGNDYSLPNQAYCESCAGCGELFFQHKMNRAWHEAKYADLFEETLYNAILGGVDLEAKNFTYTNPLDGDGRRYPWHGCPCCVGNLPRTILMLPSWMYTKTADSLYVNLFAGSEVNVGPVAGTPVRMIQTTEYPWNGNVTLTVQPASAAIFTLYVRVPDRHTSELYASTPAISGLRSLTVNGKRLPLVLKRGYATITRQWNPGDRVDLELPLAVQRIKAAPQIQATTGKVALRFGPLLYNFESVDQKLEGALDPKAVLSTVWKGDLLGGVMVIKGAFADGTPLMAIPNYARLNRGGRSMVWVPEPKGN